jgi:hypothetical protein
MKRTIFSTVKGDIFLNSSKAIVRRSALTKARFAYYGCTVCRWVKDDILMVFACNSLLLNHNYHSIMLAKIAPRFVIKGVIQTSYYANYMSVELTKQIFGDSASTFFLDDAKKYFVSGEDI